MYLSVALPVKDARDITLLFHPMRSHSDDPISILRFKVTVPVAGTIEDLKKAAQPVVLVDPSRVIVREIYINK